LGAIGVFKDQLQDVAHKISTGVGVGWMSFFTFTSSPSWWVDKTRPTLLKLIGRDKPRPV
jgi:hypothetical protein